MSEFATARIKSERFQDGFGTNVVDLSPSMFGFRVRCGAWIAAALLALSPAWAADYYVSPTGSDSAPGR